MKKNKIKKRISNNKHIKKIVNHQYIKKHRGFINYTWVGIAVTILNIFFLWLFIDIFRIPTIISSISVVGGLFLLKYYLYKKTGFAT
jgi:putative flippase GtrA